MIPVLAKLAKKTEEATWFRISDGEIGVAVRPAGPAYHKAIQKKTLAAKLRNRNEVTADLVQQIQKEALVETIWVDWDVQDETGLHVPFSKTAALQAIVDCPMLMILVTECAETLARRLHGIEEATAKNSETS